mgnify:CR=1 FL=1
MMVAFFKGIMPPMLTPFKSNGNVDYDAFIANIHKWNEYELAGYLVNGSNSETAYLNEREKLRLVQLTVKHAAAGRYIMVGTGMDSLHETIRITNMVAEMGVMSALVLTPFYYWNSMNSAAFVDYFTRLANASEIPIFIYNVPKFTHVNIKVDAVAKLADHPNITGMKDSSGDIVQLAIFKRVTEGKGFTLIMGTAGAWFPALTLEVEAGIHALANCCPQTSIAVQRAFEKGDTALARAIYQAACPLNTAVTATYGIPGLKYACTLSGYHGGFVRSPLQELDSTSRSDLEKIVVNVRKRLADLGV